MEIMFYRNVLLYQRLIVALKSAFRKIPALSVKKSPSGFGCPLNFNKQKPFGTALFTTTVFYGIYNPLTAAWLT